MEGRKARKGGRKPLTCPTPSGSHHLTHIQGRLLFLVGISEDARGGCEVIGWFFATFAVSRKPKVELLRLENGCG